MAYNPLRRPKLTAGELAMLGRATCGEAWPEIIREATGLNRRTLQRWHKLAKDQPDLELGSNADLRDEIGKGLASLGVALIKLGETIKKGGA